MEQSILIGARRTGNNNEEDADFCQPQGVETMHSRRLAIAIPAWRLKRGRPLLACCQTMRTIKNMDLVSAQQFHREATETTRASSFIKMYTKGEL